MLPHVDGSARITAGDVDIIVGVRAELETIVDPITYFTEEKPIRIDFNVEFSANWDSRFLGREPMDIAELVRSALEGAYSNEEALPSITRYKLLSSVKSFFSLKLTSRLAWKLFVDVEIHGFDGNLVDFAGIAVS